MKTIKIILPILFILCYAPCSQAITNHKNHTQKSFTSLAPILKKVMPTIVNLTVQGEVLASSQTQHSKKNPNEPPTAERFRGIGSGVIINTEQGLIVTNAHVVKNAKIIDVTLHNGRRHKARLVGIDPASDIAVVQIKSKKLQSLIIADSNRIQVGDFVVAIGNPFGLNLLGTSQTATFGIVSATKRSELRIDGGVENFIQTDAAINPGNSGGALINTRGELIGINAAIISPYGGNVGIGLAIPSNMMLSIAKQLVQYGSVKRGLMGIFVQQLTPELADALQISKQQGALITQVSPNSPASKAGLKIGDLIVSLNQNHISDAAQVKIFSGLLRVGSVAHLEVYRNKKLIPINVKIEDFESHEKAALNREPFLHGVILRNFEQTAPNLGLVQGIQVVAISETSLAQRSGLQLGDIIIAANGATIKNLQNLKKITKNKSTDKNQLLLHILRGPGAMFIVIKH